MGGVMPRTKKVKSPSNEVNPNSPKQVAALLYETLGMPEQFTIDKKTKKKKITTGKSAIKALKKRDKSGVIQALEDYRKADKERAEYGPSLLDPDGRMHTKYSQTVTDTGRLSSRKTDDDTGTDQQNLPEAFRKIVIPDPGMVLVEGDLRQAEARIFYWNAEVVELMKVCQNPNANIHKYIASQLYGLKEEEIEEDNSPDKPYGKSKRITHGTHYGLGVKHGAEVAECSVAIFKEVRNQYFKRFPRIPAFHREIRAKVLPQLDALGKVVNWPTGERVLVTPLGRRRLFLGRPNEDLVRKMLAFVPQSTCADYLNQGLVRLFGCKEMEIVGMLETSTILFDPMPELLIQTHDGFLAQCLPEYVDVFKVTAELAICAPMVVHNKVLVIPLKLKTGENWGELK
jgi:hypothetical protein